jgi:hypothetical protein
LAPKTYLKVRSQADELTSLDEPFGRVVLVPPDGVPVVHGELMVEIVVSFADGDESGDKMVARSVLVIKSTFTKIVGKRVDTESGLSAVLATWTGQDEKDTYVVDECQSEEASVNEAAPPVVPTQSANGGGKQISRRQEQWQIEPAYMSKQ